MLLRLTISIFVLITLKNISSPTLGTVRGLSLRNLLYYGLISPLKILTIYIISLGKQTKLNYPHLRIPFPSQLPIHPLKIVISKKSQMWFKKGSIYVLTQDDLSAALTVCVCKCVQWTFRCSQYHQTLRWGLMFLGSISVSLLLAWVECPS